MQSDQFFQGRYKDKVIQVDSSRTGAEEDEMVQRLLTVESAAEARILIEQSIGRGLRLPYGRRAGVAAVDRLSIVAHDKFQEIIDEANRPDSAIRLQQVIIDPTQDL
jgi:type III restriction enzyme